MKIAAEIQARLAFLVRVIEKEIEHLDYADQHVFSSTFNKTSIENLAHTPELAFKIAPRMLKSTQPDILSKSIFYAINEH